jgi:hypothetical protein
MAVANGRLSMRGFLSDMGLNPRSVGRGDSTEIARLAEKLALDPDVLRARSAAVTDRKTTIFAGSAFNRFHLSRNKFRVCPHCLAEDEADGTRKPGTRRYGRLIWMVANVMACCRHDVGLTTLHVQDHTVPDFYRALALNETMLEATAATVRRMPATLFDHFVEDRIMRRNSHGDFLDSTSLSVAIDLCQRLGTALVHGTDASVRGLDNIRLREAQAEGYKVLRSGPDDLRAALDRIAKGAKSRRHRGGTSLYGTLYVALNEDYLGPEYDHFRSILRDHARGAAALRPGASVFGELADTGFQTVRSIVKAAKSSQGMVKKYLDAFAVRHGQDRVVSEAQAADVVERVRDSITLSQATRILNLPIEDTNRISSAGLLPFVSPAAGIKPRCSMDRATKLAAQLEAFGDDALDGMTSLRSISCVIVSGHDDVLRSVFDGRLTRVSRDSGKRLLLDQLHVDFEELMRARTDITVPQAYMARSLGLRAPALLWLIREGVFPNADPSGSAIPSSDVAAFSERYVTTARLNRVINSRVLAEAGIRFAFPYPDSVQMILKREDVHKLR